MKGISSAVGFVAKLKPEIRLAQAISEFGASLNTQNQRTRFKNLQSQSPPDPDDIIRLTEEINRDGARAHRSWRPYGTRLVAILERMRQFAPIGDVLVGGSQNLIACGVWAVVRLSLETSLSFLSYFENVTSMMLRLGRSLSLHKDFAMLFPKCSKLQSYMCEYTIVMVNICAKIVHNCAKSALSQLAASLTSTFDATFKPFESDLATWAQSIEKRVTVLLAKSDLQSQASVLDRFNRLQVTMSQESASREKKERKHMLLTSLCPDQGEFNLIWRRERRRGTSTWMYGQDAYKGWLSSTFWSILWLKGNLGSGKTVAMASVAGHLISAAATMEPQGAVTVSYFFCQSGNSKTLTATALLGSIVGQALQNPALEESFMSFLAGAEITPDTCTRLEEYVEILVSATPSNWRGIFVLDGLDEMPTDEVDDVFRQLRRLGDRRRVHLLCSSRPTSQCYSIANSYMDVKWTLSMETADRSDEIRAYITAEISKWNGIRTLPTALERLVEEQLLAGCQGMYLWLSLQIEDICPKYTQELRSDAEILDILGNLPKDLPEAFDKALSRMCDDRYGSKLFKLVLSAEPPLNMDELRVACNVEPGNTKWDNSTLSRSGKALISAYGGSLLDIDEEDLRVRFIHYSVPLHLTAPSSDPRTRIFHFGLSEAERMLGAVCVTYLNYSVFENRISTAQKVSFGRVPQTTAGSVMQSEASRKAFTLLAKYRRQRDVKVDLEKLSFELQNERWRVHDDVHLFLDYAKNHWLLSSRNIWEDTHGLHQLWRNLMTNPNVLASLPWTSTFEGTTWALRNDHATLFQDYIHSVDEINFRKALSAAESVASTRPPKIRIKGIGLGWFAPLYIVQPDFKARILQAFIELGCKPYSPTRAVSPSPYLRGLLLEENAKHLIVATLRSSSRAPEMERCIIFLANYLEDPNMTVDDQSTILHLAIESGCLSLAFELLSKGANPNNGRNARGHPSPLQIAVHHNFIDLAQRLVELGADPDVDFEDGLPLIFLAIKSSYWGLFHALLLRDPFSGDQRHEPSFDAASHYICKMPFDPQFSVPALLALFQRGANINLRNEAGETPLLLAIREGSRELMNELFQYGADPTIGDNIGIRPLHYAEDAYTIRYLLQRGASLNAATNRDQVTALMVAAHRGRAEAVDALLNEGANPDPCLNTHTHVIAREIGVLDLQPEAKAHGPYRPGGAAFDLCCWRLEQELGNVWGNAFAFGARSKTEICSDLVSTIAEFLKHGVGPQPQYSATLARLGENLSRGVVLPRWLGDMVGLSRDVDYVLQLINAARTGEAFERGHHSISS
ncbi:hypothetical protein BHE90_000848 [Fusarium euwallaceae]|uniref:NACHT domain-containing protein n=1 Tax=Fusarium euwallaceae TaxID=1147111 RepID=A0A430M929_9HYPO|nr:hypothetical protein BHE90_000848 [Fusarium euwallaceae]